MASTTFAMKHIVTFGLFTLFASGAVIAAAIEDSIDSLETSATSSLVAKQQESIDDGRKEMNFHKRHGYLKSVLDLFDIPVESQLLV